MAKKGKKSDSKKQNSFLFTLTLVIIVVAVFAYLIINEGNLMPKFDNSKVIAKVNNLDITQAELDAEYNKLPEDYQTLISKDALLTQLINRKILLDEAQKNKYTAESDEVEEQLNIIKSQFTSEQEFDEVLKSQGLTLKAIKQQLAEQIIINKLIEEEVTAKIEVSEKEIADYYQANRADTTAGEGEIRAAHILLDSEEKAQEVLEKIEDGADFTELAVENSIDPSVSLNKGDLGFFSEGMMVSEFEDAAFALKIGEVSEIVETRFGYHIIKRLPDEISVTEAKENIKLTLQQQKQSEVLDTYIEDLKLAADIWIASEDEEASESEESDEYKNPFESLLESTQSKEAAKEETVTEEPFQESQEQPEKVVK
jgi:foldase protein PrsA